MLSLASQNVEGFSSYRDTDALKIWGGRDIIFLQETFSQQTPAAPIGYSIFSRNARRESANGRASGGEAILCLRKSFSNCTIRNNNDVAGFGVSIIINFKVCLKNVDSDLKFQTVQFVIIGCNLVGPFNSLIVLINLVYRIQTAR